MNVYAYAVIPLIVSFIAGLVFTVWLTLQVISSLGEAKLSIMQLLFVVFGLLAWAAVEFKIIENALATILTLSAALLSRTVALSESYTEYKHIIKKTDSNATDFKSLSSRFIEITPDIVLIVLLLVLARDIRERYEVSNGVMMLIYAIEFLYAAVVFAYIGIGDKMEEIIKKSKVKKRLY